MNVTACYDTVYTCFHANAYIHDMNMEYFGCGTCDMLDDVLPDTEMSCMECMSSYCNDEGTSGAGHLTLSSLFLVLPAVLLY